jgi:hypothetical protein
MCHYGFFPRIAGLINSWQKNEKGLKGGGRHEDYAQGAALQYSHTAGFR